MKKETTKTKVMRLLPKIYNVLTDFNITDYGDNYSGLNFWRNVFKHKLLRFKATINLPYFMNLLKEPEVFENITSILVMRGATVANIYKFRIKLLIKKKENTKQLYKQVKIREIDILNETQIYGCIDDKTDLNTLYIEGHQNDGGTDRYISNEYFNLLNNEKIISLPTASVKVQSHLYTSNLFIKSYLYGIELKNIKNIIIPVDIPTYPGWIISGHPADNCAQSEDYHIILIIIDLIFFSIEVYDPNNEYLLGSYEEIFLDIGQAIISGLKSIDKFKDIRWTNKNIKSPFNDDNINGDCSIFVINHGKFIFNGQPIYPSFDPEKRLEFRKNAKLFMLENNKNWSIFYN